MTLNNGFLRNRIFLRLPTGDINEMASRLLAGQPFTLVGCLSFEERCTRAPIELSQLPTCASVAMVEVKDPPDAFPDHSEENLRGTTRNEDLLRASGVQYDKYVADLLAEDDGIEALIRAVVNRPSAEQKLLILDITSFPKRFFCFFLRRILEGGWFDTVIATYTQAGPRGYAREHLTNDFLPPDCLPGFADVLDASSAIAVSVGFETLGLPSLIRSFLDAGKDLKMILPFPPNGRTIARSWSSVRQLVDGHQRDLLLQNLAVVAAWDVERSYGVLNAWHDDTEQLVLAPYGPKPVKAG